MSKKWVLVVFLFGVACGDIFIPDRIKVTHELPSDLVELLNLTIENELCDSVEEQGLTCEIPEQVDKICFQYLHDPEETVEYTIEFCPKGPCLPPGVEETNDGNE